ncbi:MAG TPA: response regulator [Reyranella sp.]|nr:response regulator [Reyranella sp.]
MTTKRILVVDDERAIREAMVRVLVDAGYLVAAADSMGQALALEGPWDAMVLDERLPDGSGHDIALVFPDVPVVTVSGYSHATLAKPFTNEALVEAVAALWGTA